MRRRAFLAATGTALGAGCTGNVSPPTTDSSAGNRTTTAERERETTTTHPASNDDTTNSVRTEIGPNRRLTLVTRPFHHDHEELQANVGFVGTATSEGPPRLRLSVTNPLDYKVEIPFGSTPPFGAAVGQTREGMRQRDDGSKDDEPKLVAVSVQRPTEIELAAGCWRAKQVPEPETDTPSATTLAPDETVAHEYDLLVHPETADCFPTEIFHFRDERTNFRFLLSSWNPAETAPNESRFEGRSVPDLPDSSRTGWFHESDETTPIYLEPDREMGTLPTETFRFTLSNYSTEQFTINPYDYGLYKLHDGEWRFLEPYEIPMPAKYMFSGSINERELSFDYSGDSSPMLGAGTYAYQHGSHTNDDRAVEYAALFELDGDSLPLTPGDQIDRTERDGQTKTIYAKNYNPDEYRTYTVSVRRTSEPAETSFITEELVRRDVLRPAVYYLRETDVSEIAMKVDDHPRSPEDEGTLRFEHDGETYAASVETHENR